MYKPFRLNVNRSDTSTKSSSLCLDQSLALNKTNLFRAQDKIKTLVGEARVSIESLYYKEKKERKLLEICCFDFHGCILATVNGNLMRLPWFSIKNKREK